MAENDNGGADKPAAKKAPSRRNRAAKKAPSSDGSNSSTAMRSEKVPTAQYAGGTGFEAGNVAPSTKYVNEDGEVVDKEPSGVSRVLVAEGDVVREHMVAAIKSGKSAIYPRFDNENSSGDASHS